MNTIECLFGHHNWVSAISGRDQCTNCKRLRKGDTTYGIIAVIGDFFIVQGEEGDYGTLRNDGFWQGEMVYVGAQRCVKNPVLEKYFRIQKGKRCRK